MMQVAKDIVVSMRYIMKNSKGEVLENTMAQKSASYLHGSTGIADVLQVQMEGLRQGDKKILYLAKENGLIADDFTFDIVIDGLRKALPQELALGYPVLVDEAICDEDCICYQ